MGLGLNIIDSIELPKPKYFDENGNEVEIDLNITSSSTQPYAFENTTNAIRTYFKRNIGEFAPIKAEVGNSYFEWTPLGVGIRDEYGNEEWLGRINSAEAELAEINKVIYRNLLTGIDDEFIVEHGKLKHNTILNHRPNYTGSLPGKRLDLVVEGIINFSSDIEMYVGEEKQQDTFATVEEIHFRNTQGSKTFSLPSPIAFEVVSGTEIQCLYEIKKEQSIVTLKIIVPFSWLEAPERQYPVAIDPTLSVTITSDAITRINNGAVSHDNKYLAINTLSTNKARLFKINHSLNRLEEMPQSIKGYPGSRAEYGVCFSPDNQYFLYCGYDTFAIYKFNTITQDYDIQTYSSSPTGISLTFSNDGQYIFICNNYNLFSYKFDYSTGTIGNAISSIGLAYRATKIKTTKNDKFIFTLQNTQLVCQPLNNGVISSTKIAFPAGANSHAITDFEITEDDRFIILGSTSGPFFIICPFDSTTGVIGDPIQLNFTFSGIPRKVALSKKQQYLVINRTMGNITSPRFEVFKFNNVSGQIEPFYYVPETSNIQSKWMGFTNDGEYFVYTQDTSDAKNSIYIYKFFHEPLDNVYFKDPITNDYYSDNKGNTLFLIDFGTIIAGQTTQAKQVLLENRYNFDVTNIQLNVINPSQEFKVELSITETPFIPQSSLHFQNILGNRETIPFFIRVTSTEQSLGGGMFELLVKCDRV
ncbi:hypothetical protein [Paenibacillus lactis]|uniref:hypothetical protein n=1 Tax=Paenibacillus lactis TaxID=228574 RepID=UPI003D70EFAA